MGQIKNMFKNTQKSEGITWINGLGC